MKGDNMNKYYCEECECEIHWTELSLGWVICKQCNLENETDN